MVQHRESAIVQATCHAHEVFLFDRGVLADQLTSNAAVLREDEQSGRVDVQSSCRGQTSQVQALFGSGRNWLPGIGPSVAGHDEASGRRIARIVIGMRDIADRFVENDRQALGLLAYGACGKTHHLMAHGPRAEFGHWLAIEQHEPLFDIGIGLAA